MHILVWTAIIAAGNEIIDGFDDWVKGGKKMVMCIDLDI